MMPSDAEAWARLRLVQGRANAQVWELVQSAGQTTLTVGANAGCNWPISDHGVAPIHFTLHWDGRHLHAADTYGAGDVRLDGQPLDRTFRPVSGRARIDFGHAAIVVETSITNGTEPAHPLDPGPLPPIAAARSAPPARQASLSTTLMGVSPLAHTPVREPGAVDAPSSSRPPQGASGSKSTLVGLTPVPDKAAVAAGVVAVGTVDSGVRPARGLGATLLGVGADVVVAAIASARANGAAAAQGDIRNGHGSSADNARAVSSPGHQALGRRETQQGVYSAAPGVASGAVKEARVKAISGNPSPLPASPSPAPAGDSRTTWEEIPAELGGRARESGPSYAAVPVSDEAVPRAVMVDDDEAYTASVPPPRYSAADDTWRQRRQPPYSAAPADAPEDMPFESRRPERAIPWHYVGLGALTAAAYVAWLYLLDHF